MDAFYTLISKTEPLGIQGIEGQQHRSARGVELVIEHIERYWCPSILGESLAKVIDGSAGKAISS